MSEGLLIELAKLETCKVEFKKIAEQRVYKNEVFYSRLVIHICFLNMSEDYKLSGKIYSCTSILLKFVCLDSILKLVVAV